MINQIFKWAKVRGRMAANELGIMLSFFALHLRSRGYARRTVTAYCRVVEHFGRWLKQQGVPARQIGRDLLHRFLRRHLLRCQCSRPACKAPHYARAALNGFWQFIRAEKLITSPEPKTSARNGAECLLQAYDDHLNHVRGLAVSTRRTRQYYVREFLLWRFDRRAPVPEQLRPKDVQGFITLRARHLSRSGVHTLTDALRSFLRFLEFSGRAQVRLIDAVSAPARRPSPPITATLNLEQWRTLGKSFDRSTPAAQRDYAMALCLGLLGLRGVEVAALTLDDLNWREMTLRLGRTKQQRERLLPLPDQVARALARYLRDGRPHTQSRALFVSHRPAVGQPLKVHQVRGAMRRAFQRCGIRATGTHILRHTWATWAHRRGASLKQVADVLGHRSLDTTNRYAHLNVEELRRAALPWPKIADS